MGSLDIPLNSLGLVQAKESAEILSQYEIQEIWSSPLVRASKTAEIVAQRLHIPLNIHNGLAERNYGEWEGKPKSTIDRNSLPPNGESWDQFFQRSSDAIKFILSIKGKLLIVAHSGTYRVLAELLQLSDTKIHNGVPVAINFPLSNQRGAP